MDGQYDKLWKTLASWMVDAQEISAAISMTATQSLRQMDACVVAIVASTAATWNLRRQLQELGRCLPEPNDKLHA